MVTSSNTPHGDVDPMAFVVSHPDEEQISSEVVYTGSFLKMKHDTVRLQNGMHATREYIEHPGAAMIIPLFAKGQSHESLGNIKEGRQADGKAPVTLLASKKNLVQEALSCHVLLERQYRYAVQQKVVEFPAGKLDLNESSLACAKRELREETGYTAARWYYLTRIYPSISYSTEWIDLYLAEELTLGPAQLDEGECLDIESTEAAQLLEWVKSGEIKDVKTLIGAFWLEKILLGQWDRQPV